MSQDNIFLIYMHISPSGKGYIGQSKDYDRRCREHKHIKNKCPAFRRAIAKYGWDNFTHEILEENLTLEEANEREPYYIEFYNTLAPNGYNLTTGGGTCIFSEETIQKIRDSSIGKVISQSTRDILSKLNMGENNPNWGKPRSEETKQKISESNKGKKNTKEHNIKNTNVHKKLYLITYPCGKEVFVNGLKEFCKDNNLGYANLCKTAHEKRKHHKRFKCRLATDQEILDNTPLD